MLLLKGLILGLFQVALIAVFLLVPVTILKGDVWSWNRALWFLVIYTCIQELSIVLLALKAPASLEARLKIKANSQQPFADKIITMLFVLSSLLWWAFIPIDVFYLNLFPKPSTEIAFVGFGLWLFGFLIMAWSIYQNSFARPIVVDQEEQELIDDGLYGYVRHPLYMGLIVWLIGIALWLESFISVIAVFPISGILIGRIMVEEKALLKTLPGYKEYMNRVKYRIFPFIW